MIKREIEAELRAAAAEYPVVTIVGPRQSGKTTLARLVFPDKPYYSLEEPDIRLQASEDPRGFLAGVPNGAVLDEIQRLPELLSYIQGLVDASPEPGRFVLTGSHQPQLHEAVSQSLAGRTAVLTLWPFSMPELKTYREAWSPFELMVTGGYPRVHDRQLDPRRFYNGYVQTYVERDVRILLELRDLDVFQKFLKLLAGRIGQLVNYSSLSNDVGVSVSTIKNWLSVLMATYLVVELQPYFENVSKRVVKSPKLYFTDVGLAAYLLGIHDADQAARDPLRGALFENLILTEVLKGAYNRGYRPQVYFYRDSNGNEVDLVIREGRRLIPIEIKSASTFTPDFIRGIRRLQEASPDAGPSGFVLYSGDRDFVFKETRVLNPLSQQDLWSTLTAESSEVEIDG
ncbi:MAG: DUF4143 domain-containing protein [Candidatus Hydrogenedens sp.]|nr:DUF4143 domain-containing protein [Candidatus Hydrogenedens sp.]